MGPKVSETELVVSDDADDVTDDVVSSITLVKSDSSRSSCFGLSAAVKAEQEFESATHVELDP